MIHLEAGHREADDRRIELLFRQVHGGDESALWDLIQEIARNPRDQRWAMTMAERVKKAARSLLPQLQEGLDLKKRITPFVHEKSEELNRLTDQVFYSERDAENTLGSFWHTVRRMGQAGWSNVVPYLDEAQEEFRMFKHSVDQWVQALRDLEAAGGLE